MLPQHDDLENPPEYTQLRDDYWAALGEIARLRKENHTLTERANRGHRAYLCNQGIPEADAEREANRVFPALTNE